MDPTSKRAVGRYDATTRRMFLNELALQHETFTLADYLDAVDHAVSRQQALVYLQACAGLKTTGTGRGARWSRS